MPNILPKKKRSAPSPNLGPRGTNTLNSQDRPKLESSTPVVSVPRSTTFPVSTPNQNSNLQRSSLDGNRFQLNTLSTPNLRQSYHEMMSPKDFSNTGTPNSSSASPSMSQPYSTPHQFGAVDSFNDLNSMMFPSADPFAYPPNHPMMELENFKQENTGMANDSQTPSFLSDTGAPGVYDDLEGQLFGPIPPYLTQGQQNYDFQGQPSSGGMMSHLNPPDMNYHPGLTPNGDMNFLLSGDSSEWDNILADGRLR